MTQQQAHNLVLSSLPAQERKRLLERGERVQLAYYDPVFEPEEPITYVFFPLVGIISVTSYSPDGRIIEVGTIGNEGMAGLPVFLGTQSIPMRAFCQVPGESLRVPAEDFRSQVRASEAMRDVLGRYTHAFLVQTAQTAACNRLHSIEQRAARWILMTQDRTQSDQFMLTQEVLGQMLGVRRQSITEAAGALQRKGLIAYRRGVLTVTNRTGLKHAACECYGIIINDYQRVLGAWPR